MELPFCLLCKPTYLPLALFHCCEKYTHLPLKPSPVAMEGGGMQKSLLKTYTHCLLTKNRCDFPRNIPTIFESYEIELHHLCLYRSVIIPSTTWNDDLKKKHPVVWCWRMYINRSDFSSFPERKYLIRFRFFVHRLRKVQYKTYLHKRSFRK
jgi:hypothetical protein